MNTKKALVAATNIAIIVAAVLLVVVVTKRYLFTATEVTPAKPTVSAPIVVGTNISIPGVEWSRTRKTMIVALNEECRFCTESAPFYKRLLAKASVNKNLQVIAVLPQDPANARRYLNSLGV